MEDSKKSNQIENTKNNRDLIQKKQKIFEKLDSLHQLSLQINNENINQVMSINNQDIFLRSVLINGAKDEVNDSQFKLVYQGNSSNPNKLRNSNSELMVIKNLSKTNSNQGKREGIISKSFQKVTQSTNFTLSNDKNQQIPLNQQNNQSLLYQQSRLQVQNQIIENIDQSRPLGNQNVLNNGPFIMAKSIQKEVFQETTNKQEQEYQWANFNNAYFDNNSNSISKKDSTPQQIELNRQGSYFKKQNESTYTINGSTKQLNLIKYGQQDEINEQSLISQSISSTYYQKSNDYPQAVDQITPYQDYYDQYQNYFIQNVTYSQLSQSVIKQSQNINQNDIKVELQEIAFSKEENKIAKDQEAKNFNYSQDQDPQVEKKQEEENQDQNANNIKFQNNVETPKNFFDIQSSDFESLKGQTELNKQISSNKRTQSLNKKFRNTITKDQTTTPIMDHQTTYTIDQDRIKSQTFDQGLELLISGNSNTAFSQKINTIQLNNEQESQINQSEKR